MDTRLIFEQLDRAGRLERLDDLLEARARMRRVYSVLGDAYNVTHNPAFTEYLSMLAVVGRELNDDIKQVLDDINTMHGGVPDEDPGSDPSEEV